MILENNTEHWKYKLKRSKNMSNSFINDAYDLALKMVQNGGKLIGAGGGGFILFFKPLIVYEKPY